MLTIFKALALFYALYIALVVLLITTLTAAFMISVLLEDRRKKRGKNGNGLHDRQKRL